MSAYRWEQALARGPQFAGTSIGGAAETEAYCRVQHAMDYSSISRAILQKTGVFLDSAGDLWEFSAKKVRTSVSRD
jgi:hypothetical protein